MADMELFNQATAEILAKLYDAFPMLVYELKVADLTEPTDRDRFFAYRDIIIFLQREGFVRYENRSDPNVDQAGVGVPASRFGMVSLSLNALKILNSTPESLEVKEPIGQQLATAVKEGSKDAAKGLVSRILMAGASAAWNGLTGG